MGHTERVQKLSIHFQERLWQIVPISMVILIQSWRGFLAGGWSGIPLVYICWIVVGWIAGWLFAELDHVFYLLISKPEELTSQRVRAELNKKNWRGMWKLIQDTKEEREKLPMRNMLTMFVILILGLWAITTDANTFVIGLTYGLAIRLFSEFIRETDWRKWYWVFAREFGEKEHRLIFISIVVMVGVQTLLLWG